MRPQELCAESRDRSGERGELHCKRKIEGRVRPHGSVATEPDFGDTVATKNQVNRAVMTAPAIFRIRVAYWRAYQVQRLARVYVHISLIIVL